MGGYSGIYSPEGDLIAQIQGTDSDTMSAQIDLGQARLWREKEKIGPFSWDLPVPAWAFDLLRPQPRTTCDCLSRKSPNL